MKILIFIITQHSSFVRPKVQLITSKKPGIKLAVMPVYLFSCSQCGTTGTMRNLDFQPQYFFVLIIKCLTDSCLLVKIT